MSRTLSTVSLVVRLAAAVILGQTLIFKFTGAAEAVWIFDQLGVEPYGRLFTAVIELAAVVLLLLPKTRALGGLAALGLMGGAIPAHLFVLGIEVQGDGGLLFAMACVVAALGAFLAWIHRAELPVVGGHFAQPERA